MDPIAKGEDGGPDGVGVGAGEEGGERLRRFAGERIQVDLVVGDGKVASPAAQVHPADVHQDGAEPEEEAVAPILDDFREGAFQRPHVEVVRGGSVVADEAQGDAIQARAELGDESAGALFRVAADVVGDVHSSSGAIGPSIL